MCQFLTYSCRAGEWTHEIPSSVSQRLPSSEPAASSAHCHSQGQTIFGSLWITAAHWKQVVYFLKIMVTCVTTPPGNTVKSLTSSYFHGSTTSKRLPTSWTKQHENIFQKYNKAGTWTGDAQQLIRAGDLAAPQTLKHMKDSTCMKTGVLPPIKNSDCPQAWWLKRKDTDGNTW